jgi:hypothetical protein
MTVRLGTDRTETDEVLSGITNILLDRGQKCEIPFTLLWAVKINFPMLYHIISVTFPTS